MTLEKLDNQGIVSFVQVKATLLNHLVPGESLSEDFATCLKNIEQGVKLGLPLM